MIVDTLPQFQKYAVLSKGFETAAAFLRDCDLNGIKSGKFEIDGDRVYGILTEKELAAVPGAGEAHRAYADVQIILSGSEAIGWCPMARVPNPPAFAEGSDNIVITGAEWLNIPLEAGMFAIFFPEDAHRPNLPGNGGTFSRKLVIKVKLP